MQSRSTCVRARSQLTLGQSRTGLGTGLDIDVPRLEVQYGELQRSPRESDC
jgi:hypothetical protein